MFIKSVHLLLFSFLYSLEPKFLVFSKELQLPISIVTENLSRALQVSKIQDIMQTSLSMILMHGYIPCIPKAGTHVLQLHRISYCSNTENFMQVQLVKHSSEVHTRTF